MISLARGSGRLSLKVLVVALGICGLSGSSSEARAEGHDGIGHEDQIGSASGGRNLYPGNYGFGLKYHPGYGYGGAGIGVGPFGGYPFYGGPGYPPQDPPLRRFGRISPMLYHGGPGYSTCDHPNYFGIVGPLTVNRSVVEVGDQRASGDYGPYTGALPYSTRFFSPYSAPDLANSSRKPKSPTAALSRR